MYTYMKLQELYRKHNSLNTFGILQYIIANLIQISTSANDCQVSKWYGRTPVGLDSEKRLFSRKDTKRGEMMRKEEKEGNERGERYIQDI